MEQVLYTRFHRLWQAICPKGHPESCFSMLAERYNKPDRAYHNFRHIAECLELLDTVGDSAEPVTAVEAALWFHDAVYDSRAKDNEELSALLASTALGSGKAPPELITLVTELILVTRRHLPEGRPGFGLMCDLDLSILGRAPSRYDEYCKAVRQEYGWVSDADFAAGRSSFLKSMLARPAIFVTPHFHEMLERPARANITGELEAPQS